MQGFARVQPQTPDRSRFVQMLERRCWGLWLMLPQTHTLHTPPRHGHPLVQTHTHRHKHTHTQTHIHTHRGTHEHIYKKTYVQALAWTRRRTYPTCASPHIETHRHICTHTRRKQTHHASTPHTDTHTHTGTHRHPLSRHTQRHTLRSLRTSASCLPHPGPP